MGFKSCHLNRALKIFSKFFPALSLHLKQMQLLYLARVEVSLTSSFVVGTGFLKFTASEEKLPYLTKLRGHELFENSTFSFL